MTMTMTMVMTMTMTMVSKMTMHAPREDNIVLQEIRMASAMAIMQRGTIALLFQSLHSDD